MAYTKIGPFHDGTGPYLSAATFTAMDAAIATIPATAPTPSGGDDTASLNAWTATLAGKLGIIPPGSYKTTGTVSIPAGATIYGYGAAIVGQSGAFNIVTVASNVNLYGLEVTSLRGAGAMTGGGGIYTTGTTGVTIQDCNIHAINTQAVTLVNSSHFLIVNNDISDCYQQGIYIDHSTWGRIASNDIWNTQHGIQWWGGDSANAANYTAGRPVHHLTITGNTIKDGNAAVSAGIWGSLGQWITVTGNTVENMSDLAIDLEGTWDSTVTGNTVNEAGQGCYSAVNGCKRVVFADNVATNLVSGGAAFRADWGTGVTWASTDITVSGNTFTTVLASITMAGGSMTMSDITDNHISVTSTTDPSGVIVLIHANELAVSGNRIYLNVGGTAIKLFGSSNGIVTNNKIVTFSDPTSSGSQNAGILLQYDTASWPAQYNRVAGNVVRGFVKAVYDNCTTDPAYTLIEANQGATIAHNGTTGYAGVINNNRSATPATVSTTTVI